MKRGRWLGQVAAEVGEVQGCRLVSCSRYMSKFECAHACSCASVVVCVCVCVCMHVFVCVCVFARVLSCESVHGKMCPESAFATIGRGETSRGD